MATDARASTISTGWVNSALTPRHRAAFWRNDVTLPMADAAGVDVNEARFRIVANAAVRQRFSKRDVDCHAVHVQAVRCNTAGRPMQHRVGRWRTVAGDDPERRSGVEPAVQRIQQIEQLGIDPQEAFGYSIIERSRWLSSLSAPGT